MHDNVKKTPMDIYHEAVAAGMSALRNATPQPMVVRGYNGYQATVSEGVCGFAWVNIPGRGKFAKWAKENRVARKSYLKGYDFWVSEGGQSMERKEAYAYAFAEVLRKYGINAYAQSRMD